MTLSSGSDWFKTFWNSCCVDIQQHSAELRNSQLTLSGALRLARRKSSRSTPDLEDTQPAWLCNRPVLTVVGPKEHWKRKIKGNKEAQDSQDTCHLRMHCWNESCSHLLEPPQSRKGSRHPATPPWRLHEVLHDRCNERTGHLLQALKSGTSTGSYSCVCSAWLGSIVFLGELIAGYRRDTKLWSIHDLQEQIKEMDIMQNDAFVLGNQQLQWKWMNECELSWHSIVCQPSQSRLGSEKRVPCREALGVQWSEYVPLQLRQSMPNLVVKLKQNTWPKITTARI